MNQLQIFKNEELGQVRAMTNDDGSISINAEDTAIGFGWQEEKQGKIYPRWRTLNGYLQEIGFSQEVAKDDYIPESLFYRLGMKANNKTAEKFQNWLAIDVIPSIRKTGTYQKPLTPSEIMRIQLEMIDNVSVRVGKLEDTMVIDYGQQRVLANLVNSSVLDALGGKGTIAYKQMAKKVFAECNRDIKDYFNVNSRNNIPKMRFDEACSYIKLWSPCANTKFEIKYVKEF